VGAEAGSAGDVLVVLGVTLRVALGATALCAPCAFLVALALARRDFPGKSLVETVVALPLVLPPTAVGYLLLALLARRGPLGEDALGFDPGILFTWKGAVLAAAVVSAPLVVRTARVAFEGVDPRLVRMARTLGMSAPEAFLRVTLPLAGRGLLAALFLGFGRAVGEFGATVIVAGNIPGRTQTIALAIFEGIQLGDARRTWTHVGITVALAFALVWTIERLQRPRGRARAA
jgi:molybdate transport system permease protein